MAVQIVANSCLPVYNHLFSFALCHFLSYAAVKKAVIQNESGFFKQKTNVLRLADWHLIIQSLSVITLLLAWDIHVVWGGGDRLGTPSPFQPLRAGATQVFIVTLRSALSWCDIWVHQRWQRNASGIGAPGVVAPGSRLRIWGAGVVRQLSRFVLGHGFTLYG